MAGRKQLGGLKKKQIILYVQGESIDFVGGQDKILEICYEAIKKHIRSKKWKESNAQKASEADPASKPLPTRERTRKNKPPTTPSSNNIV